MSCLCQSQLEASACCEPIIKGTQTAKTAEQLMRARYTAYSQINMEFIEQSHDPKTRNQTDMEANTQWAKKTTWLDLKIVNTEKGQASDKTGVIEFKAKFSSNDEEQWHHEKSEFTKRDGQWYFSHGRDLTKETFVRSEKKVGRNEPCPCGSGKKSKKCCGA